MFEVISEYAGLKMSQVFASLEKAIAHARYLRCSYYGPSPEILGSHMDATILIRPVR